MFVQAVEFARRVSSVLKKRLPMQAVQEHAARLRLNTDEHFEVPPYSGYLIELGTSMTPEKARPSRGAMVVNSPGTGIGWYDANGSFRLMDAGEQVNADFILDIIDGHHP